MLEESVGTRSLLFADWRTGSNFGARTPPHSLVVAPRPYARRRGSHDGNDFGGGGGLVDGGRRRGCTTAAEETEACAERFSGNRRVEVRRRAQQHGPAAYQDRGALGRGGAGRSTHDLQAIAVADARLADPQQSGSQASTQVLHERGDRVRGGRGSDRRLRGRIRPGDRASSTSGIGNVECPEVAPSSAYGGQNVEEQVSAVRLRIEQ